MHQGWTDGCRFVAFLHLTSGFCFSLQINANCRIRSVYFTDRLYSSEELPSAYRVNLSGESQTGPGSRAALADGSLMVPPESRRQRYVKRLHQLRTEVGPRPTPAGEDYVCGLYTILNSTDIEPLKFWATEVSV